MIPSITPSPSGERITRNNDGQLLVPNAPLLPFIEGDGIGPDVWRAARAVINAAVEKAYAGQKQIAWLEVLAGQKAFDQTGEWLPQATIDAFNTCLVGIKGPLTTPISGGIRSLNVALRKALDLYVCQRPVRWFNGLPSPVRMPEKIDLVVFRENTEDIYTGIEFVAGSQDNKRFLTLLQDNFPAEYEKLRFTENVGLGIKPVSKQGSERLIRAAIQWALDNQRKSVTLVHKGNIMKYTEGAFRTWGYALAEAEFGAQVYTWEQWQRTKSASGEETANAEMNTALAAGKLLIKDLIADIAFEKLLTAPDTLDVLATMNLNGDYLSDAAAAQVGGVGIAPGGNINYVTGHALFEATHGTAPLFADRNVANPSSVILSGEMMLRHLGWDEAADLVRKGIETAIHQRTLTFDLHKLIVGAKLLSTSEFGDAVIQCMKL
ncbi:MAG: NADP-dependent isocitrate dehydrogenase [Anaerolineaceae bacterium]|jgi:isocitrate dehydrogenase|nr:NADP-dependent isocitrate dehydrogenase [Anaerolineaceae bacterium]